VGGYAPDIKRMLSINSTCRRIFVKRLACLRPLMRMGQMILACLSCCPSKGGKFPRRGNVSEVPGWLGGRIGKLRVGEGERRDDRKMETDVSCPKGLGRGPHHQDIWGGHAGEAKKVDSPSEQKGKNSSPTHERQGARTLSKGGPESKKKGGQRRRGPKALTVTEKTHMGSERPWS